MTRSGMSIESDVHLRLECLRLAGARSTGDRLVLAARIYAFAIGETDQTPRERLLAAMDAFAAKSAG